MDSNHFDFQLGSMNESILDSFFPNDLGFKQVSSPLLGLQADMDFLISSIIPSMFTGDPRAQSVGALTDIPHSRPPSQVRQEETSFLEYLQYDCPESTFYNYSAISSYLAVLSSAHVSSYSDRHGEYTDQDSVPSLSPQSQVLSLESPLLPDYSNVSSPEHVFSYSENIPFPTDVLYSSGVSTDYIFKCAVQGCNSSFSRKYGLKSHMDTHSKLKTHICPELNCGSAFKRKHDLTRHSHIHTKKRPHTCPKCNKTFPRKDALTSHNKTRNACNVYR
ncbi:hypothetical protein CLU79DRAFT_765615 [Phycomyces nitens]|nr:hypothetical protein CLU79DRAFT_765615 [Phycomyces nitens]